MSAHTDLRVVLETVRRHVERAAAGTGLQAMSMTMDLRFGLRADDNALVKPSLRTSDEATAGAPHSLRLSVALGEDPSRNEG